MMNALEAPRAAALDVEVAAADHLAAALRRSGCTVRRQAVGASRLLQMEVWRGTGHLLMRLRAALAPNEPVTLNADEAKAFRLEAQRANAEPWVAYVALGPEMELRRLDWRPLEERERAG